jgi:hypothetical protein
MDPFAALGVGSAVVQFVDFSVKLISSGHQLYKEGALPVNDELEQVTMDLTQLCEDLSADHPGIPAMQLSKDEASLQQLASSCKKVGNELLSLLVTLKPREYRNGLESFRKALRTARKKGKISNIEERLKRVQTELSIRLIAIMRSFYPLFGIEIRLIETLATNNQPSYRH